MNRSSFILFIDSPLLHNLTLKSNITVITSPLIHYLVTSPVWTSSSSFLFVSSFSNPAPPSQVMCFMINIWVYQSYLFILRMFPWRDSCKYVSILCKYVFTCLVFTPTINYHFLNLSRTYSSYVVLYMWSPLDLTCLSPLTLIVCLLPTLTKFDYLHNHNIFRLSLLVFMVFLSDILVVRKNNWRRKYFEHENRC